MSLYNISVKAEPDWVIGSSNVDQTESRNSMDSSVVKENEYSSNAHMKQAAAESSSNEPVAALVAGDPLRVATPGYHRRPTWYTKERSSNFSKQECQLLRGIIDKYSDILFKKKTDTETNLKKKAAWVKIEAEFNAGSPNKRTLRQLQAKLDNMKRNRKKKLRSEAHNQLKVVVIPRLTTPSPPANNSDDESRVSLDTAPRDRVSPGGFVHEQASNMLRLVPSVPPALPRTRVSRVRHTHTHTPSQPRFRKRVKPTETEYERIQNLRQTKLDAIHTTMEHDRVLFETKLQHLEEKRTEDREIYELKKRKLKLEISLLEKQNKK